VGIFSKPDPRLLQQACEALGVAVERTLVIGDSLADVLLARPLAGISQSAGAAGCIGFTGGWSRAFALETNPVIHQFEEIEVILA
jgi:phosphoglycolate phosphatase